MISYFIFILALVGLDQLVKVLVRTHIPLLGSVEFLPGIMDFTYVQNTGAAFSMLSQHTWLLTVVSAVVSVVLIVLLCKNIVRHPIGKATLSMVIAGALGNLIDRAAFGFVTDMFRILFINFAVFNVADICVVVGGIAFCVYFIFFYDKLEGTPDQPEKGDPHGNDSDNG